MTDHATVLRQQLIRNVDEVELERQQRAPLYDTRCGGGSTGTAAAKLGFAITGRALLADGRPVAWAPNLRATLAVYRFEGR